MEQNNIGIADSFPAFSKEYGDNKLYFRTDYRSKSQSYCLEDENKKVVLELQTIKNGIIDDSAFLLKNFIDGKEEEFRISHTITDENSNSNDSFFYINGDKIWDYLSDRGITITKKDVHDHAHSIFYLIRNQTPFAEIHTSGTRVHEEEEPKSALIRKLVDFPTRGFYRIHSFAEDLDLLFIAVFAISRTEIEVSE